MNIKTKSLTKTALFSALIAVGSFVPVPMYPVPVTLQTFFVFMAGLLLTPAEAFLSVAVYTIIGLVGIPVFAGFTGGVQSVFSPSFGFILGFSLGAYSIALLVRKFKEESIYKNFLAIFIGNAFIYLIGLTYMYFILKSLGKAPDSLYGVLSIGMIPFIPGDLLKMIVASIAAPKIKKALMD
ncbi:biotin transporter BioY [Peptoniphilus catoniae]|uniref:biotin transporter BioY n=1 Tax=Peptoniphilus catoniae TaxID=1660341 RepID=UPI0010FCF177|nr:biotin transporter BioY [Peptoniphilus catoniae]